MQQPTKAIFIFALLFFTGLASVTAQNQPIQITGKIVESGGRQPVEYATVVAKTVSDDSMLEGTTTAEDGSFTLTTENPEIYLEISFIGFETQIVSELKIKNGRAELGTIAVNEDNQTLEEVVVRGEKSQTEFKLDKRVFNVGQDLSSTGASALEVLNNVPSVTVNIEGQIRLRGSAGVQILINGKPSVLTSEGGNALGTLTADMIERIEVITNPSAKYEAAGTSGIINIVIKKEEKRGFNGSVTLNTGMPNNHSLGLSVNNRTEKFNLFSQLGIGHRTFPQQSRTINRDLTDNTTVSSDGVSDKNETFFNIILGTDYHINSYNVISLTGHFAYELETEFSDTDFTFLDQNNSITSIQNRDEETEAVNPKYQYELQYKKDFPDNEEHTLLFSALGSFFGKDQSSEFINTTPSDNLTLDRQRTRTDFLEGEYTFKLDYTQPFNEQFTLETGAQYVITDVTNDFGVSNPQGGEWVEDPSLTDVFDYDQKVLGVYGTGAYEGERFGVKLGLRLENTDLRTLLINTGEGNTQQFTNLFPSGHTSYKVSDNFSLQAGYSRRIYRPNLWDLNPFTNIRNNFSVSTGNPLLLPEFTDSYEVTSIYDRDKFSFNVAVYHRYTTDVIEEVATFETVPVLDEERRVSLTRPENIGTNNSTGVELNAKYNPVDWWVINADFNYNYFSREGEFESVSFDFTGDQWSSRLTNKFKLPADIDLELIGNYQSGYVTVQGEVSGFAFADLGLRKKMMKGKTILNLSIRDIFASRIFESETRQPNFYLYDYRLRGRFITVGVSFGFGKGEAMEFSGQKRF
ncbi:MAG: outer membrane beta-barrel family protein [Bacteroidota bacterium]